MGTKNKMPQRLTVADKQMVIASLRKCASGGDSCDGCAYVKGRFPCRMRELMSDAATLLERDN